MARTVSDDNQLFYHLLKFALVGGEAASCISPANRNDGFKLLGSVLAKLKAYRGTGAVGSNSRFGITQRLFSSKLAGDVHEFFVAFEISANYQCAG